jgi:MerR family transcriptional regulator, thiopeptide resistance regulator
MTNEELYEGLSPKEIKELSEEAKERWGNTRQYKESEEKMRNLSKEGWDKIKDEGAAILREGVMLINMNIKSEKVQALIASHYKHLLNFYEPTLEMYRGLAEMYVGDSRFRAHFEKYHPQLPQFMHDAILEFIEKNKKTAENK